MGAQDSVIEFIGKVLIPETKTRAITPIQLLADPLPQHLLIKTIVVLWEESLLFAAAQPANCKQSKDGQNN